MTQTIAVKLTKWGNSLGLRIPKQLAKSINATEGTELTIREENNKLIIERRSPKPKYDLADLLSQITPENRHAAIDWGEPVGDEIW